MLHYEYFYIKHEEYELISALLWIKHEKVTQKISGFKLAISRLKGGKAARVDRSVTSESLRYGERALANALQDICNKVLHTCCPLSQWITNVIIFIFKKGNSQHIQNYRDISLMSTMAKTYNRMLLDRIYTSVNELLQPKQAGFRRDMNCIDQIHALRRIIKGARDKNLPCLVTFVDFSKAFDSIDREIMWRILRH